MAEAATEVVPAPAAPAPVVAPLPAPVLNMDWRSHIPDDVKSDQGFTPIIDKISEKDIPSLIKTHLHLVKKMGNAVNIPGKGSKAEDVGAFLDKVVTGFPKEEAATLRSALRKSDFLPQIPESADKYTITPPQDYGELDQGLVGKAQQIFHEGEVSQPVADKLMGLYYEATKDVGPILNELKDLVPTLKQTKADAMTEWETEVRNNGHDFEQVKAVVGRYVAKTYPAEKIALLGDYGNNPIVLDMVYKNALASGEDIGPIVTGAEAKPTPEQEEAEGIMFGHKGYEKEHEIWKGRGPAATAMQNRVSELFRKSTGGR